MASATGRRRPHPTFDDGPDPRCTVPILDLLRRYGATVTFFCVGLNAHAHPRIVERIATDGHEVANHTWSHPYLPDLSGAELDAQLERTNDALARVTGRSDHGAVGRRVVGQGPGRARTSSSGPRWTV